MRNEDKVRNDAVVILGFNDEEVGVQQGAGQITTFNELGFSGVSDKPDGWYLPDDRMSVAIIFEAKAERVDISKQKWVDELIKNVRIANTKYSKVVGILYNGAEIRVFKNEEEVTSPAATLQPVHPKIIIGFYCFSSPAAA